MANIVITNNGDPSLGDPDLKITDSNGVVTVLPAGACTGLDIELTYTVVKQPAG